MPKQPSFSSDSASLPPPPFLVWVIFITVISCGIYTGYYVIWETLIGSSTTPGILRLFGQIMTTTVSTGSSTVYNQMTDVITPHPFSILILSVLIVGYQYYFPFIWATLQWVWYTVIGKRLPDIHTQREGFLVSPNMNPEITKWTIMRRSLLDKLQKRLFTLQPPHGIRCGTSQSWEPSKKLIHLYLRRLAMMYSVSTDTSSMKRSEKMLNESIRRICEERSIIQNIISSMEIDPTIQYTYQQAKEHIQPLLAFYEINRIHYQRRVVDDILGLPIGQRDPYNETQDNIINTHSHILPTQTNSLQQLDKISSIPQESRIYRGTNDKPPIAPYLRMESQ
jgi:hypothetical protein